MLRALIYGFFVSTITACGANDVGQTEKREITATTVFARAECNADFSREMVEWIDNPQQFMQVMRRINAHIISNHLPVVPQVDFQSNAILLVAMGKQPTSGYFLSLANQNVPVSDKTASVLLEWHQPGAETLTASVLTHPCILVELPLADYAELRVIDTMGQQRFIISVPEK